MNRIQFRRAVIELLYLKSMEGDHREGQFDEEVIQVVDDCFLHLEEIDQIISDNLMNWTIDRLNYVDKAIIRYAVYEMIYTDTPTEIIINEAINLTKELTNLDDDQAKGFNNRLLDNISLKLKKK
ncbi:MAG: transcription antitermination factor NusB [Candidatus Izemoplasmatales bacterium]